MKNVNYIYSIEFSKLLLYYLNQSGYLMPSAIKKNKKNNDAIAYSPACVKSEL